MHENPELGYEDFETSKLIRGELDKMGIKPDLDALPMQEMLEWEHKSKSSGKMHICGHVTHVAMLLGVAKILQEHCKSFKGPVTYNYKELKSAMKNFSEEYKLGEGGFVDVYKGYCCSK
ncbi:hypothetical protein POM88_026244 [Heracleum sosnowskyi]|uniref:Uncharacterized protein n=1 Tax=Heracleum sosnowskyi TaxID=360622 RepID=A0AAD8MKH7_9APIA|nr:hypothetical protein POM88_026244 [Heracleum sosnowskyi]